MTKHTSSVFLAIIFCYVISLSSCNTSTTCGPFGNDKSKVFGDSTKIAVPFDSVNLFLISNGYDSLRYDMQFSDKLVDSLQVKINVNGTYLTSDSILPNKNVLWSNDTVSITMDYFGALAIRKEMPTKIITKDHSDTILCSPIPRQFTITHTTIEVPKNWSVDSIGYLHWKIMK